MRSRKEDRPGDAPPGDPPEEPSFSDLLRGSVRVVAGSLACAAVAYAVWRGLRALFPEVPWLQ